MPKMPKIRKTKARKNSAYKSEEIEFPNDLTSFFMAGKAFKLLKGLKTRKVLRALSPIFDCEFIVNNSVTLISTTDISSKFHVSRIYACGWINNPFAATLIANSIIKTTLNTWFIYANF